MQIKGPQDVLAMGIDNYNNECRKIVMRYSKVAPNVYTTFVYMHARCLCCD